MNKNDALKLALEALNTPRPSDSYPPLWQAYEKTINKAITAIKEALAQPKQQDRLQDAAAIGLAVATWTGGMFVQQRSDTGQFENWVTTSVDRLGNAVKDFLSTSLQPKPQPELPEQEPVAYFDWLPEKATHIARIKVKTMSGGRLEMGTHAFKYDNEVLMVYATDNDNEYPGWRKAKECFYHLNFPIFPIPTVPPKRPWVGLTDNDKCTVALAESGVEQGWIDGYRDGLQHAEAKLKEKNT